MKVKVLKEKKLTKAEKKKKEDIVMGMKGNKAYMKKKYGDDWESIMYALATKKAKELAEQSDDLYIGGSVERIPSKEERRKKVVEDLEFLQIKQIGQGNFGTVFRATEGKGKYRDAAVKVIDKGGSHAKREIKNYVAINDARKKNKYIARHFPEVYDIFETDDHAVIVMELLDPTSAGMSVVGDFLQGPEGVYRVGRPDRSMKDIDKMYKDAYGDDAGLMKTDLTGRVKNMMLDAKVFSKLLEEFLKNFSLDIKAQDEIIKKVLGSSRGILNAKQDVSKKNAREILSDLLQFGAMEPKTLSVLLKDLKADLTLSWMVALMIKETYTAVENKEQFPEMLKYAINDLILKIRTTSAVSVVYDNVYSDEDIKDAEPGAASLMLAINALINDFGIIPHDVHDKNALVRTGTGDIVIVDVGNFKEGGPLPPPLTENRRMIKVFIDKKR